MSTTPLLEIQEMVLLTLVRAEDARARVAVPHEPSKNARWRLSSGRRQLQNLQLPSGCDHMRSKMAAMPWPPPMHMVTSA